MHGGPANQRLGRIFASSDILSLRRPCAAPPYRRASAARKPCGDPRNPRRGRIYAPSAVLVEVVVHEALRPPLNSPRLPDIDAVFHGLRATTAIHVELNCPSSSGTQGASRVHEQRIHSTAFMGYVNSSSLVFLDEMICDYYLYKKM
ncbi:hypothetical protein EJB05_50590, partial [Eragrostis curvula]